MKTTRTMKNFLENKKGQAFPLAALGLFIMALSVLATLNLGQAIHQRIHLQNTADSAAYSLAAIEARAFNYVSLLNRVQIVHYNSAMAFQSYLNYSGYCMYVLSTVRDILACLRESFATGCKACPLLVFPPAVAICKIAYCIPEKILKIVVKVFTVILKIFWFIWKLIHIAAADIVAGLTFLNKYIVWHQQIVRLATVNAHIITGMSAIVNCMYSTEDQCQGTDRYDSSYNNWVTAVNALLNTMDFRDAFDAASGMVPSAIDVAMVWKLYSNYNDFVDHKTDENKIATGIMAELANGSRSSKAIYDRSEDGMAAIYLAANLWGKKRGTTKLIQLKDTEPKPEIKQLRKEERYPLAEVLASDDFIEDANGLGAGIVAWVYLQDTTMGGVGQGIVSTYGDKSERKHYGYKDNGDKAAHPKGGWTGMIAIPPLLKNPKKTIDKDMDCGIAKHRWSGIAPYFKYNIPTDGDDSDIRNKEFNQPSTWIFLNVNHSSFQTGTDENTSRKENWHRKFKWTHGGEEAELDTTVGGENNSFLLEGMMAMSRGLVYYHRPGNWVEPPNFFNPFWRAKLAPFGNKFMTVLDSLFDSGSSDASSSTLFSGIFSFIKNFLKDAIFVAITSILTH
jgi:Putative Flp pilus-assembly TadE/G-like